MFYHYYYLTNTTKKTRLSHEKSTELRTFDEARFFHNFFSLYVDATSENRREREREGPLQTAVSKSAIVEYKSRQIRFRVRTF